MHILRYAYNLPLLLVPLVGCHSIYPKQSDVTDTLSISYLTTNRQPLTSIRDYVNLPENTIQVTSYNELITVLTKYKTNHLTLIIHGKPGHIGLGTEFDITNEKLTTKDKQLGDDLLAILSNLHCQQITFMSCNSGTMYLPSTDTQCHTLQEYLEWKTAKQITPLPNRKITYTLGTPL